MFCFTKGPIAILKIAKNASTSWREALLNDGWIEEDLLTAMDKIDEKIWIGFLREPMKRHTVGVVHYLLRENKLWMVNSLDFIPMLCSGVFDEHSYSVHHMLPTEIIQRTHWLLIDDKFRDHVHLTRNICKCFGIDIPTVSFLNTAPKLVIECRDIIDKFKEENPQYCASLRQNFLMRDIHLYNDWSKCQFLYANWRPDEIGINILHPRLFELPSINPFEIISIARM
jgi:hypothetical protein